MRRFNERAKAEDCQDLRAMPPLRQAAPVPLPLPRVREP